MSARPEPEEEIEEEGVPETEVSDRRSELTPGRTVEMETPTVQFRTPGRDIQRDEPEEGEDTVEHATAAMARITLLERALRAEEIRRQHAEERASTGKRFSMRTSVGRARASSASEYEGKIYKPKINKPRTFRGRYSPLMNVLNWLVAFERYILSFSLPEEEWAQYAYSHFGSSVQAWANSKFQREQNPDWEDFKNALILRYLPPDHELRLEQIYEGIRQRSTLSQYVEAWQDLDSAMLFAQLIFKDSQKVMRFIKGMRDKEEQYKLHHARPRTLEEAYQEVMIIVRTKLLNSNTPEPRKGRGPRRTKGRRHYSSSSDSRSPKRSYKRLEGKDRERAWAEGLCLECGSKDHMVAKCPHVKRAVKRFEKRFTRPPSRSSTSKATKGSRGKKRFYKLETKEKESDSDSETESEEEPTSEHSGSDGSDSESPQSGSENSDPESQG